MIINVILVKKVNISTKMFVIPANKTNTSTITHAILASKDNSSMINHVTHALKDYFGTEINAITAHKVNSSMITNVTTVLKANLSMKMMMKFLVVITAPNINMNTRVDAINADNLSTNITDSASLAQVISISTSKAALQRSNQL